MDDGVGHLVVSLDFELHWGVCDHWTVDDYRDNLLGVWTAVPAMLEAFRHYGMHATWATVGFLFAKHRDELEEAMPSARPTYRRRGLSSYERLADIGTSEEDDPFHYAPSLIEKIAATPGQEVGSHTFSHCYCLEVGQTVEQFVADLEAAQSIARRRGLTLRSMVFPRNQYDEAYVEALPRAGFDVFRGSTAGWVYRPRRSADESLHRRAVRLLDAYLPLTGPNAVAPRTTKGGPVDVPASRFLRPYSESRRHLDGLRLQRIRRGMRVAAREGGDYHLWWHPHNFGKHLQENLGFLRAVLDEFARLREQAGMKSVNMGERAAILCSG